MRNERNKGITFITLIITIIIMLILVGVTINITLNKDNGIIKKAFDAKEINSYETAREWLNIKIAEIEMNIVEKENRKATLEDIIEVLSSEKETDIIIKAYTPIAKVDLLSNGATDLNDVDFFSISDITVEVSDYLFQITHERQMFYIGRIRRRGYSYS